MKRKSMKVFFFIMVMVLVLGVMGPSLLYAQTGTGDNLSSYPKDSTGFVWYVYNKVLDRDPAQSEVNIWVDRFQDKSASAFTLVWSAIFGPEMSKMTASVSNNDYIGFLYMSIFQRSPDTAGWDYWTGLMAKGWSKEDILEGFGRSTEFAKLAANFGVTPFFTKEVSDETSTSPAKVGSVFSAILNPANSVPPVSTSASGSIVFTLSADGKSLSFDLLVTDILNPQAAHIHMGDATTNGPVIVPLFPMGTFAVQPQTPLPFGGRLSSGTITAANFTGPLAGKTMADLVAAIKAGKAYVNVHTLVYPAGEMRGQIK
jgi:hypothetical protein